MQIYDVKKFGAVGNGFILDTQAIQQAIDSCSASGGGQVLLSNGIFLTGTIIIRDNVTICLDKNAMLLGSSRPEDYEVNIRSFVDAVGQERGKCLIYADHVKNIGIIGEGIVHGRGETFAGENNKYRPFLLRMVSCRNVELEGITQKNSAAWCTHLLDCEDVKIRDVTITSRVNGNNDGIDIDSCRNVRVERCRIDTGDDGICLKSTIHKPCENIDISNCLVSSRWAAFKIGTESLGDFKNITIADCHFYDVMGCGIKIVPVDGANVENVLIKNIIMTNCTGPIFIALGERSKTYFEGDMPRKIGSIKNLFISGIKADVIDAEGSIYKGQPWGNARGCIVVSGVPAQKLENVHVYNSEFVMPGGIIDTGTISNIPEMGSQYPEFHVFGTLPAFGFYIRHVKGMQIKNIQMRIKNSDNRKAVFLDDGVEMEEYEITDIMNQAVNMKGDRGLYCKSM